MKVTVKDYLNVRVGKPSLNAPNYQYLAPGSVLEVDGTLYPGDKFEGIDTWYKDEAGNYYWSGGVEKENEEELIDKNPYKLALSYLVNWNESIPQIPVEWRESKGKGVKIAILDTGVYNLHEDLKNAIAYYEDFTPVKDNIDYTGHGTHVAGIIGARSSTSNGIVGVAPQSELIILKVLYDGKDPLMKNYQSIIDALDKAVNMDADIINMSFSLRMGKNSDEDKILMVDTLKNKITEIGNKNIIMVASAGDNDVLDKKRIFFPAICDEVISVATINKGYFDAYPDYNHDLNIVGPYVSYISTYISPYYYKALPGCSMTTAFISGLIALIISSKKNHSKSELLSLLGLYSRQIDALAYNNKNVFNFNII